MRHTVITAFLVVLACVACAPQARGSTLSLASESSYAIPYSDAPFDITAAGNLDWVVTYYSEKAGGTAITTTAQNSAEYETHPQGFWLPNTGYPTFSWTDGFNDPQTAAVAGLIYGDGVNGVGTHIALPAGSGTISVWWVWAVAGGNASFTASFDDGTSYVAPDTNSALKTVLNYSTETSQTLTFQTNGYAGVFAMAVSTVPEPGTLVLLALGLLGLSACAWRKRK
jgi:hypothetical protein